MLDNSTAFLLETQAFGLEISGKTENFFVSFLDCDRLKPSPWAESSEPVVLIEDRDKYTHRCREFRYEKIGFGEAFELANAVLLVLHRWPQGRSRLGQERRQREHQAAVDMTLAAGGVRVFIRATTDRLQYWCHIVKTFAPPECIFRFTDTDGASRIFAETGEV
ncbi:hypothetical protein [Metarhizobium album]|uniref:hypothetical protein n=1 Tax=Metarhizobium album TaxID=2182425 RepID=UPI000FFF071C|nr:hypothetical protein [Rhizobium album]